VAISALQGRIGTEKNVRACETGDVTSLLNSVRRGGNPNQEGHRGISVLTCLVLNNAGIDDFEELARLGANMNKLDSRGLTPLIIACVRHEVVLLHCLLKHGALPSGRDSQRRTALHWCALQSHEDGIHTLLKYEEEKSGNGSAFLNMVDSNGDTALSLAAQSRNGLICKVLCTLGADFTKKNREGRSPAMMARERGFSEISEWLDKRMGAGVVKLESSSDVQFERQMRYGAIKVKELIRSFMTVCGRLLGVDMQSTWLVNAAHCRRAAALPLIQQRIFVTALSGLLKDGGEGLEELQTIVESILLEVRLGRCCPNVSVSSGSLDWTPLMCAVFIGDCHLIKLLVKQGALVDIGNIHGTTALMLAAALNCVDASFELLSLGADVTCCDLEGFSVHVYSTLLPASKEVAKSVIEAALGGSSTSVRMFTTSDLFRLLKTHSSDDVRELMQANMIEREASLQKTSLTKTLEKHGLTNTSTVVSADLVQQLRVLDSRLGMIAQVRGDISRTMVKNKVGEGRMITVKEGGSSVVRCMLCTLPLPCSHFATAEAMRKREQVDGADEGALMEGVMVTPKKFQSAFAQELIKASRVYERQSERLLLDAEIGDRSIDRNLLMVSR
jgi:ankyrin repeat protein